LSLSVLTVRDRIANEFLSNIAISSLFHFLSAGAYSKSLMKLFANLARGLALMSFISNFYKRKYN